MGKKVLVTGANGTLGSLLVKRLLDTTAYDVIAVVRSPEKYRDLLEKIQARKHERLFFLENSKLIDTELENLYAAVHMAFARRNRPSAEIAGSIDFSAQVFRKLAQSDVQRVINISSQGIYGDTDEIRTEQTPPAPVTAYTMAKYAAEKICNFCFADSGKEFTNLRLDLVIQSQNLVPALCRQAKKGKICLKGGEQRFSFIDAEDAVRAVEAMIQSKGEWEQTYNVGWNRKRYKLTEVADIVKSVAEKMEYKNVEILLEEKDISLWAGMDSTKFEKHTGWEPKIDIYEMVERIFRSMMR